MESLLCKQWTGNLDWSNNYFINTLLIRKAKVRSMRAVSLIKGILLNICSMVCIALKVLDWYNPYMDFAGHAVFIPYTLYISVFPMQFWKHFPVETDTKTEEKEHRVLLVTGDIPHRVLLGTKWTVNTEFKKCLGNFPYGFKTGNYIKHILNERSVHYDKKQN